MAINGLPPASDGSSGYRVEQPSNSGKNKTAKSSGPSDKTPMESFQKLISQQKANMEAASTAEVKPEKSVNASAAELQTREEATRQAQTSYQTTQAMSELDHSIVEARSQLAKETSQLQDSASATAAASASYWDRLDVVEKAQKINQLKEKIAAMELQRSQLTSSLKEQVMNGTYKVSGSEILAGMLKEFF